MDQLDISDVARRSGVPASTLRYYEEKGLIASTGRRGLRRQFDTDVFDRLALIALGRVAGFSLAEIGVLVGGAAGLTMDRKMLTAKADQLDGQISRLTAVRDGLRHAAACPATRHIECPSFRKYMNAAHLGDLRV